MERNYSDETKGRITGWSIHHTEHFLQEAFIEGCNSKIKKLEAGIQRIVTNPKNEGQATYQDAIEDRSRKIVLLREAIDEFNLVKTAKNSLCFGS